MRDYSARWLLIGCCGLVGYAALAALGIGVDAGSARSRVGGILNLLVLGAVLGRLARTAQPRLRRPLAVGGDYCLSLAQLVAAIAVVAPFSYLAAMSGLPLLDGELARLDAALGFHWDTAAAWVADRPAVDRLFYGAYFSLTYQPFAVLLLGSVLRTGERNREMVWLTAVGLIACISVSAFTPALGKGGHVGTGYLDAIHALRGGTWTVLDYEKFEGIVTFPSFHSASAIFLTYIVRHCRPALAVLAPLNLVMLAATPTHGGHYLVDVLAGAAVAVACILLVRRVERRTPGAAVRPVADRPALPEPSLSPG